MAKRRKTIVVEEEIDDGRPPRRKGRFVRRMIMLSALLIVVVAVGPMLIANSPFCDMLLNWQMPVGGWRLKSGQARLSWTGSQSLANVAVIDPHGNPLATVEQIALERSLLGLAINSHNLGTVRITRPTLHVIGHPSGSNIEDFLAAIEKRHAWTTVTDEAAAESSRQVDLEVVEGAIRGTDVTTNETWQLEQINMTVAQSTQPGTLTVDGAAVVPGVGDKVAGRLKFRVTPTDDRRQQLDLLADNLALAAFAPWMRRAIGENQLTGLISLDGHVVWSPTPEGNLTIESWGRAEATDVVITAAALQGDQLRSQRVVVPWKIAVDDRVITAEELKLDSEWADLAVTGSLALADLDNLDLTQLPRRDMSVTGEIALAPVTAMLRRTLRLRDGVRIDSGDLTAIVKAEPNDGKFTWTANAQLANLVGRDGGRAIQWNEPVEVSATWIESPAGARLDRVKLTAPFAGLDFTTTNQRVSGDFQVDLAQLTSQAGQLVDLRGLAGQGVATGKLNLTASEGDAFAADADIALTEFALKRHGTALWQEPNLQVSVEAVGSADELRPMSLSTGSLEIRGARDQWTFTLLAPVDLTKQSAWSVAVDGAGPLDSWAGRLRPWFTGVPNEITGHATLAAHTTIAPGAIRLQNLQGTVEGLRMRSGAMALDEPHIEFSGDCAWDTLQRKLHSAQLVLASSVVAFRSRDLRLEFPLEAVPVVTGDVAFRTDLERLFGTLGLIAPEGMWPRGLASGDVRLATNSQQLLAEFTFNAEPWQLMKGATAGTPQTVWADPKLHSSGKAIYSLSSQRASIDNLRIDGQSMKLVGKAEWDKPLANGPIGVAGHLEYDPATVARLIASYTGPQVNVQGDRMLRFEARGRLPQTGGNEHWSRMWQGRAETGWTSASVFGLPISAAKFQAELGDGQLRFAPLDVSIGEGRLSVRPLAILAPVPAHLIIAGGPLITNVQISAEVSEQMLKYVAPVLAGATRVDGRFSLELAETRVPFDDPHRARTAGKLDVHQLTVLPGPLLVDIVRIIQQVQSLKKPENLLGAVTAPNQTKLLTMEDQQVEFQVFDGRVYHRQLEFIIDDVPIRSTGSVGFDQTLALEINIPIQDRWIDGEDALRGLAGQTLTIPIQGTFQNPRVDQRALAQITRQLIRNTAGQAIGNEINRQLEKLFQGK